MHDRNHGPRVRLYEGRARDKIIVVHGSCEKINEFFIEEKSVSIVRTSKPSPTKRAGEPIGKNTKVSRQNNTIHHVIGAIFFVGRISFAQERKSRYSLFRRVHSPSPRPTFYLLPGMFLAGTGLNTPNARRLFCVESRYIIKLGYSIYIQYLAYDCLVCIVVDR